MNDVARRRFPLGLRSALWLLAGLSLLVPVTAGAQNVVYFSVGTSGATDLTHGFSRTVTISGGTGTATFSSPQRNNIGVGDRVSYGVGPTIVYITARASSTVFTVRTATGGVPANIAAQTVNSITRAFPTLTLAIAGAGDPTHLNTFNLTGAGNFQLNLAMYNDGPMNDGNVLIDGYTTDATRYIRVFAPVAPGHVGVRQRHTGKARTGFRMVPVATPGAVYSVIQVADDYVRIEGIEIDGSSVTGSTSWVYGIRVNTAVLPTADIRIDKVLIHDLSMAGDDKDVTGIFVQEGEARISNSIIYRLHNSAINGGGGGTPDTWGIQLETGATGGYVYNNTIYDMKNLVAAGNVNGIFRGGGTLSVRNTVVLDAADTGGATPCFSAVLPAPSSNNVSSDGTAPGAGSVTGQTSYSTYFRSILSGAEDLHLLNDSMALWGANGTDLDADANLPVTDDVDGETRHATAPDIGADEFGQTYYRSIGTAVDFNGPAGDNIDVNAGSTTVTKQFGVGWLAAKRGRGDRLTVGGNHYMILRVDSDNQLTLASPAIADYNSNYIIARQFDTLQDWEDCISHGTDGAAVEGPASCNGFFEVASVSLVADNRSEVGIAYNDSIVPADPDFTEVVRINGLNVNGNTDALHTITLTADPGNRHFGIPGAGVLIDNPGVPDEPAIQVQDDYVTVEWMEIQGGGAVAPNGIVVQGISPGSGVTAASRNVFRYNLIHVPGFGISLDDGDLVTDVYNNIVHSGFTAIRISFSPLEAWSQYNILNNTLYNYSSAGFNSSANAGAQQILLINNIAGSATGTAFQSNQFPVNGASCRNLSANSSDSDPTAANVSPCGQSRQEDVDTDLDFVSTTPGSEDLHILSTSAARDNGQDVSSLFQTDIDFGIRPSSWDMGADETGTTEVTLSSFAALPGDRSMTLEWRTASELSNLGFHLYRSLGENGPWTRLTTSLIPGLGSSAVGQAYSYRDSGLTNGTRYFYRLEDVDASSKTTSHGPVSAVPQAGAGKGSEPSGSNKNDKKKASASSCPDWVLSAYASAVGSDAATTSLRCTRHGDPEAVSLGVLSHDSRQATLELRTGGFYALYEASGTVRVFVPGFDFPQDEKAAALPIRRALTDAVVGRRVQLGGVRALDLVSFKGLVPSSLGKAEMQVGWDGTVRAARRSTRVQARQFPKSELVSLLPSLFQGEQKSAVVEIAPLRFDAQRQQLVLAKRVLVKLLFTGREVGESGRGSVGRAQGPKTPVVADEILGRLYTTSRGLYSVSFEQLFPGQSRGFTASQLRLERQGEPVGLHLEPSGDSFGPGSRLYFYADKAAGSTEFSGEVAYELVRSAGGVGMPLQSAAPGSSALASASRVLRQFETNRIYQPGLLDAVDPWLWEPLVSGVTRVKSFTLTGVSGSGEAELEVYVQGASESGQAVDHHLSVSLNGTLVGEARFAGKKPYTMSLSLPGSLLREGANDFSLTNVGDTGVTSLVFLDRFDINHPQTSSLASGLFEGTWAQSGSATVSGLTGSAALVDVTATPQWLTGYQASGGGVSFQAVAGHRYLVASQEALLVPRVAAREASTLRATTNQADYILVAPKAFLPAAEALVQRRADQGLTTRGVAFEEIATEFGHGQPSAEAIKGFLAYAYQSWTRPSPRYVLLLGDASYDPRNFIGSSPAAPLPALWTKTSYLWTVSDPQLAAVNGQDALPDLAIGRLPAATVEQAEALVAKLLAWEDSGQGLSGAAALVADNPDIAGDFEANARDIAESYLSDRSPQLLQLSELGAGTRPAILDALNSGLSYLNYVGHGGAAVWASENVWNSWDAPSLLAQSQQPLLVTMNCLNGYFVAPSFDSLSESLMKAEGRGAIASFTPSGLSLDGPAHQYHRALMAELTSGTHATLGDAILAAQKAYASSGLMPELLSVYHLLGDPATSIR